MAFWMVAGFSSARNACLVCITISSLAGKLHRLSLEEVGPAGNVRPRDSNAMGLAVALCSALLDES